MDITLYFFLFSIISVLFFFYWFSNYIAFPILIIILSLAGALLVVNSPPYIVEGVTETTNDNVTTQTLITTNIPLMNTSFLTTFMVMFLLAILMWSFGREGRREFDS